MPESVGELFVKIRPNTTGFASEAQGDVQKAGTSLGKVFAAAFAAVGVAEIGKSIITAATEHQAAFTVLDQAIKNAGASTTGFGQSVEGLLEKEARLKGFSDEQLAQAMLRLVSVTHDSTTAFHDLQDAEDLARARGIDLATAALAISKAEQGKATSLQRYGIVVPQVTAAEDALTKGRQKAIEQGAKFNATQNDAYKAALAVAKAQDAAAQQTEALAIVEQRFGGTAGKFADTASGQFQRLEQDVHQLEVAVGKDLLPALTGGAEAVGHFATALAESDRVQQDVKAGAHDIGQALEVVKTVAEALAPILETVAEDGTKVVSAIGGPAIVTAAATYYALSKALGAVSSAQAFYAKAVAASAGTRDVEVSAERVQQAALAGLTEALAANTAALRANAVAAGALVPEYTAIDAELVGQTGAAEAATAANIELAASMEGVGATGATEAAGGLGAFASGIGELGLGAAGGPVGLAVIGLAAVAGGIVYLATKESEGTRATKLFVGGLKDLNTALDALPTDKLALAQAKLNVQQAQNATASSKASHDSLAYKQLLLNERQAVLDLATAQKGLGSDRAKAASGLAAETAGAQALAAATAARANVNQQVNFKSQYEDAAGRAATQTKAAAEAAGTYADGLRQQAAAERDLTPLVKHNIDLLADYTDRIHKVPTSQTIKFFLDNKDAKASIADLLAAMQAAASQAAAAGTIVGQNFFDAVANGIGAATKGAGGIAAGASVTESLGAIFDPLKAAESAAAAAKTLLTKAKPDAAAQAAIEALKQGIAGDKTDLAQLAQNLADAVTQGAQAVNQAVDQAKQNLVTIGEGLGASIGTFLTTPLDQAGQALTAEGDRLTARFDAVNAKLTERATVLQLEQQQIQLQQQTRVAAYAGVDAQLAREDAAATVAANQRTARFAAESATLAREDAAATVETNQRTARFAAENALLTQEQNRIGLRADQQNVANLKREIVLPGGKQLSDNTKVALAELEALEKKTKDPALQAFITQLQTADIGERKDKIGIATTPNPAEAAAAARRQERESRISLAEQPTSKEAAAAATRQAKEAKNALAQLPTAAEATKAATVGLAASRIALEQAGNAAKQQAAEIVIQLKKDNLAVLTDAANLETQTATKMLANLTTLFDEGKLKFATFSKDVAVVLTKAGVTPAKAKAVLGVAGAANLFGDVGGISAQAAAQTAGPQRPGSGLTPSIVRPLDTLHQSQKTIAADAKTQRDETNTLLKAQIALTKKNNATVRAARFTNSLAKNPGAQSKVQQFLTGVSG